MVNKLISYINFTQLSNWSVHALLNIDFGYNEKYSLVKIGNFLKRNKTQIVIQDTVEYKRPTIKLYNKWIQLRDIEVGKNIWTKNQFLIKKWQFLLSKIDARNGAFGVVPEECDGWIITGNFWTFDVDYNKVNPYFLSLVTTTQQFLKFSQSASNGTTNRHYLQEDQFLDMKIPLPPLSEQQRIVDRYHELIDLAQSQSQQAEQKKQEIESYLMEELGIEFTENKTEKGKLFWVESKTLERWDVWDERNSVKIKWQFKKLGAILSIKSWNFLPASKMIPWSYKVYWWNWENWTHDSFCFEWKRIIIWRVWEKCWNIHIINWKYRVTDNAFITDLLDYNINIEYLGAVLKVMNLNQFRILSAQPSISQTSIKNISIPYPPLDIQQSIIAHIQSLETDIKSLQLQSQENQTRALIEFEEEIFS